MSNVSYITEEGLRKLKEDLKQLESVERPSISAQIAEARDKGDLSENAEYDAAKEAQGLLEARIAKLKGTLANARVIDETKLDCDKVQLLNKVRLMNLKTKMEVVYMISPDSEADLKQGKVAVSTPIAKGLLGKKVGEKASITVPSGIIEFEVLEITL